MVNDCDLMYMLAIIFWVILLYSLFLGGMVPISWQPTIPAYQNIIFDGSILTFHHHIVQFQYHILQYFCQIWWFPFFFFLTFDGFILTLYSTNITRDCTFVTFGGCFIFFITFDSFILTLCNSNITCVRF